MFEPRRVESDNFVLSLPETYTRITLEFPRRRTPPANNPPITSRAKPAGSGTAAELLLPGASVRPKFARQSRYPCCPFIFPVTPRDVVGSIDRAILVVVAEQVARLVAADDLDHEIIDRVIEIAGRISKRNVVVGKRRRADDVETRCRSF